MKIELYRSQPESTENFELLESFELKDVKYQLEAEVKALKAEQVRQAEKAAKEKAKKEAEAKKKESDDKNAEGEAKSEDEKKEETTKAETAEAAKIKINPDDLPAIPIPKVKISIELSRSGYMLISKAAAGNHVITVEKARREKQLTKEQLKQARERLRWYHLRDENKIKTDSARNEFEGMIYSLKDWLNEESNAPYIQESKKEALLSYLEEKSDWLYEEGANKGYSVY